MLPTFYYERNFSALDGLLKEILWKERKVLVSMSFKRSGDLWKLVLRAVEDETMMVTFQEGNEPSECLELFFRRYRVGGKQLPRWYVSRY